MKSKLMKEIAFVVIIVGVFVKAYIRHNRGEEAQNPTPDVAAESVSETTEDLLGQDLPEQEIDQDTFYRPSPSYINVGNRTWTAGNLGIRIAKRYEGGWDTLGVMTSKGAVFSMIEALDACPSGFRIPRREEFQNRDVEELGVGTWWTSNAVNMYTTERPVEGSGYPERTNHVFAAVAQVFERSQQVVFSESNIQEKHSVLCISDASEPIVTMVSDMPDMITVKSGTITSVKFEPHYNGDRLGDCADCCCHEGDGGVLQIQLEGNDGSVETDTVYEFGEYPLCILPGYESFGEMGAPDPATCINPEMGNLNLLALFQKGAYVESKRCRYKIYERGWESEYISDYSCGDTLTVSFTGVLRDIQPVSDEYVTMCTYKILNPETGDIITTTHECKSVMIASTYRVKATVTYTDDSFGIRIPAVHDVSYFLCCNGRGDSRGDEYSRIDFELVEE